MKKFTLIMLAAFVMLFAAAMAVASENETVNAAVENTTAEVAVENATEAVDDTATAVVEAEAPAKEAAEENATAPAENESEPAKEQPGFEGIFAIAGLLAVSSLVLGKRE